MNAEKRNNIIEFYEKEVWISGMRGKETLTDSEIEKLGKSNWFGRWMLCKAFDKFVNLIKNIYTDHF